MRGGDSKVHAPALRNNLAEYTFAPLYFSFHLLVSAITTSHPYLRLTCSSCGVLARRSPFCLFWSLRHCRPTRPVSLTQLVVPRTVLVLSPPRYLYCLSVLRLPGNHRINVSVCSRRPTLVVLSHQSICLFSFILLVLFHRCICPVSLTQPFLSHRFTCPSRSLYP